MDANNKMLVMDMTGFGCTSCAYAIEKAGRRIDGVENMIVDLATHEIRITYNGNRDDIAAALVALVNRLGHDIRPRPESDTCCGNCNA